MCDMVTKTLTQRVLGPEQLTIAESFAESTDQKFNGSIEKYFQ